MKVTWQYTYLSIFMSKVMYNSSQITSSRLTNYNPYCVNLRYSCTVWLFYSSKRPESQNDSVEYTTWTCDICHGPRVEYIYIHHCSMVHYIANTIRSHITNHDQNMLNFNDGMTVGSLYITYIHMFHITRYERTFKVVRTQHKQMLNKYTKVKLKHVLRKMIRQMRTIVFIESMFCATFCFYYTVV